MQSFECQQCGAVGPRANGFSICGHHYCRPCATTALAARPDSPPGGVFRLADPTVCVRCDADADRTAWPETAGLPMCGGCARFAMQRPFPAWLTLSAVLVAGIVATGVLIYAPFITAYVQLSHAADALVDGDAARATELALAAEQSLARFEFRAKDEVRALRAACQGTQLIWADRPAEALPLLKQARDFMPEYALFVEYAEALIAADARDWPRFLDQAHSVRRRFPDDLHYRMLCAAAESCMYASTGDEAHRVAAEELLASVESEMPAPEGNLAEEAQRIRDRLATREIIEAEEYDPCLDGWEAEPRP